MQNRTHPIDPLPAKSREQIQERAGYFPVSGAHLYTVLHAVDNPAARVLLVGPFASERHNSYLPWVRWARYLAEANIEVLRYDYRGVGESTGDFETLTFTDWGEDVRLLCAWLQERSPQAPLLLHGLGLGAVLAGRAFDEGAGDGLLLWSAPANANQALRATLMRWVGLEQIFKFGDDRRSASDYIREIEQGSALEVDGYRWSPALWRDSFQFNLPAALASEVEATEAYKRPVKLVKLTRDAAPLTKGGLVGYDDLKDFTWLFAPNREWLVSMASRSGASQSRSKQLMPDAARVNSSATGTSIETRQLITVDGLGVRLQGTYHRAAERASDQSRVGALFLNSLSLPRAASGDSAAHWADDLASLGYPAFRIDLPGLGDSDGESNTDLLDFINAGGFANVAAAVVRQVMQQFNLSGMVLFGHCAGSVSALYAGANSPDCRGLILLDPYFHLPQARRAKVREELSNWARRSRVGRLFSNVYDHARSVAMLARGSAPPGNANAQLLARWKQVAAAGLPVLLLKAPGIKAQGSKPRMGEFDYIDHIVKLAGKKGRVAAEFVEGADHSFANRKGRDEVGRHMDRWLAAYFPLSRFELKSTENTPSRSKDDKLGASKQVATPADRYCALEGR